ncbi:retrovirus-related pol polyprotein from transposon TNT 1-94 [Tanacetum coccineum]
MKIEESLNVKFDETPPPSKTTPLVDDDLDEEEEELNQFIANDVWELVPHPKSTTIIGTKWVYRNKLDKNGIVSQNKARLVAQGYNQQEGINYDETYALVARLESIRILLAYARALDFKLFQMDVKSAFLNGFINEEVYVAQPPGFIDFEKFNHVYKLKKALYGLKQALKACLLYLTASRPDIMFSVCLYARFQEDPKSSHIEAVKRIFRYIKSSTHLGLWYYKGTGIESLAYADSDLAGDYVDQKALVVKMDDPNITMEEYIRLEEEKARATYGKIWCNEDVHDLKSIEIEFSAIVLNDALTSEVALSCEPTVNPLNDNQIDFRILFDESDDKDYRVIYDKNSFSYKIIYVDDLKTDLENDYDIVNMPSFSSPKPTVSYFNDLDFFKDFENEFPAIVYNDALTSKLDFLTKPAVSPQHIDEFDLKDETSLFECDGEEQNILYIGT